MESIKETGKKRLVRCLVCGEIMEEGTLVCPVCGVGPDQFVLYEQIETVFRRDTKEVFLILGKGIAALSAAKAIRERNETCGILLIGEERELPYNRPMLTKSMSEGLSEESLTIQKSEWYDENRILLLNEKTVETVVPDKKEVRLTDGMTFLYDKCIYALGATSFIPPYVGANLPEVVAVRNIKDAQKVALLAAQSKSAVVIGGGILGLETAWELTKKQVKVTVVEMAPRIMPRQIGAETSVRLTEIASIHGIEIMTHATVKGILGAEHVTAVELEGDIRIPADMVVISCGIKAITAQAVEAGIACNRAIVVDSYMQTNFRDVYACGDCAEFEGMNYALWTEATQMGKVAGANACGERMEYQHDLYPVTFHGMNTSLYAIGDNGTREGINYQIVNGEAIKADQMEQYYFVEDTLVGAVLLGDTSKSAWVEEAVKGKKQQKELFLDKKSKDTKGETKMEKYICNVCGYEYDEAAGEPDNGIAPGTKFADLPADYVCPICGAGKDEFDKA